MSVAHGHVDALVTEDALCQRYRQHRHSGFCARFAVGTPEAAAGDEALLFELVDRVKEHRSKRRVARRGVHDVLLDDFPRGRLLAELQTVLQTRDPNDAEVPRAIVDVFGGSGVGVSEACIRRKQKLLLERRTARNSRDWVKAAGGAAEAAKALITMVVGRGRSASYARDMMWEFGEQKTPDRPDLHRRGRVIPDAGAGGGLPRQNANAPGDRGVVGRVVARAGFEPATFGL